jgi:hypothetical protein
VGASTNVFVLYNNAGVLGNLGIGTGLSVTGGNINITGTVTAGGPIGSATVVPIITYNAQGQLTTVTSATITPAWSSITSTPTTLAGYGITSPLNVAQGGTAAVTLTAHAVLLGEGTSAVGFATIGTQYNVLTDQGAAADPAFNTLTSIIDGAFAGTAQGNILYRDSTAWKVLAPGTNGQFLKTQGASANPVWATGGSGSPGGTSGQIQYNSSGSFGGFTASGDATVNTATGAVAVTKTNGTAFGTGATANAPAFSYTAGNWYAQFPQMVTPFAGAAMVVGSIYYTPVYIPVSGNVESLAVRATTGSAGSVAMAVAIYTNASGNVPGNIIANSAGNTNTTTGAITFSLTVPGVAAVTPGWYWLAFQAPDTTQRLYTYQQTLGAVTGGWGYYFGNSSVGSVLGSTATLHYSQTGATGTWPSPATPVAAATNTGPMFAYQLQ